MIKAPYVVYANTESIIRPTTTPTTNSNTTQTSEHVPCSYFYIVVRSDGEVTNMSTYCGEDCMDEFFSNLECEIEKIRNDLKNIRPLEMTKEDRDRHRAADLCWVCDGPFEDYQPGDTHCLWKVQDHDHIRGHLKSSHIADKRKNFHMALYPLPPSSNESVIDNGRNVWQMATHIILVLPNNLLKQCRLSLAGTLPWRFSVHCEINKETISKQWKKIRFLLFFLFLHAQQQKWVAGVDECRTEADASHSLPIWRLQPGLQKPIDDISDGSAPPAFFAWTCLRSRNDFQHFIGDLLLSASAAVRLVDGRALSFLFLFFFYCRSHNESGPNPLPPI